MDKRIIAHLDLDTFFVSCERLADPRLIGRPVLVGGTSGRGVVAACSYEARAYGVHSAMPMGMAKNLCPEAIIIKGNSGPYIEKSKEVTEIIRESVPLFEKSSIDEFYIDLTGMDKFFDSYKMMSELRQRIMKETGLPLSFGQSENKTVSKMATSEAKPNNQMLINEGTEKHFLSPLSVRKIPMVGEKSYLTLCNLGIKKIKTVQEMPLELMQSALGKNGGMIWTKANGIDHSPVIPFHERKSISTERTFDKDTTDGKKLEGIMAAMAENLAFQLRRGNKVTSCVTVKIRYADFSTHSSQNKIPYTSADHALVPKALDLFRKLYNKRLLIRLIGLRYSDISQGGTQISLFDTSLETIKLYEAMDKVRIKYGDRAVIRASGIDARTIGRVNPFNGEPPSLLANRRV